jgi:formate dehydrogenase
MKRGAYIVNTARGKIADRDAIVRARELGDGLARGAGDVWYPQPPPADHPYKLWPGKAGPGYASPGRVMRTLEK